MRSRWWDTAYALGNVRESYRALGPARLYEVQDDPRGIIKAPSSPPREDYDASFEVDQVGQSYDQIRKAWRDAPARRTGTAWTRQLDQEIASLADPVSGLGRVNAGERGAVAPAAERVRQQVERVRPLVEAHGAELPRAMLEAWEQMFGVVRSLGNP